MKPQVPVATLEERGAEARRNCQGGVGFEAGGHPLREGVFTFTWTDAEGIRHAVLADGHDEAAQFLLGFTGWRNVKREKAA